MGSGDDNDGERELAPRRVVVACGAILVIWVLAYLAANVIATVSRIDATADRAEANLAEVVKAANAYSYVCDDLMSKSFGSCLAWEFGCQQNDTAEECVVAQTRCITYETLYARYCDVDQVGLV
jgi:hypothetical protein